VSTLPGASQPANGLRTALNIVVAPDAAFAALRERSTWVWAFVITLVASAVAGIVMVPAIVHAFTVWYPGELAHDPRAAAMTSEQQAQALNVALGFARLGWIGTSFSGIIAALVSAVVLLVASAIGRGSVNFGRSFGLAMNVAIVNFAIAQLVVAAIVAARGPDAFSAPIELNFVIPSLAWLAPSAAPKVAAFLAAFNPFSLWSLWLIGAGNVAIARTHPAVAYSAALLLTLCTAAILSSGAR
jgi:hypothetical protein